MITRSRIAPSARTSRLKPARLMGLAAILILSCQQEPQGAPAGAQGVKAAADVRAAKPLKPAAALLAVGAQVPPFAALTHLGARATPAAFARRPWVVVFPQQDVVGVSQALRDAWLPLNERVDAVLVFASQDTSALRAVAAEHQLPVLLVSDPSREVQAAFGVTEGSGLVGFVVSPKGQISAVLSDVSTTTLTERIAAAVGQ